MEQLRFIHTADLHLGSPFLGMAGLSKDAQDKLKNSTFTAFDRLIAYTLETKPDFVLIAGDIYDGEDRSLRAQHRFQQGMEQLARAGIPVVLSYGNHDHLSGKWARFELPENVYSFGPEVSTYSLPTPKGTVQISGFSYGERHVKRAMIGQYPASDGEGYHIGMLHGSMDGESSHAVYAPFTKMQLISKNYDYWALGHIHLRQVLNEQPPIVYPGNIQGRHRNEQGVKGFYDVRLSKQSTALQFISTSAVHFGAVEVACSGFAHMNELLDVVTERLMTFTQEYSSAAVDVTIVPEDEAAMELLGQTDTASLLETLRETAEAIEPWVWINRLTIAGGTGSEMPAIGEKLMEGMNTWELSDWKAVVNELYRHPKAARFLDPLDDAAANEVLAETEEYLRRFLLERG